MQETHHRFSTALEIEKALLLGVSLLPLSPVETLTLVHFALPFVIYRHLLLSRFLSVVPVRRSVALGTRARRRAAR